MAETSLSANSICELSDCRTFELSLYFSYQPTRVYASLIRSDHKVVLSDQNGDLVAHCPFKKKKAISALIKRKTL